MKRAPQHPGQLQLDVAWQTSIVGAAAVATAIDPKPRPAGRPRKLTGRALVAHIIDRHVKASEGFSPGRAEVYERMTLPELREIVTHGQGIEVSRAKRQLIVRGAEVDQ